MSVNKSRQIALFAASGIAIFAFIICAFYNFMYIFSLFCGFLSYVILMFATFKSINNKISQKIQNAKALESMESTESLESKGQDSKKILKFIDLSKVSLGFEFSFSVPRILAFLFMVASFLLLIFCGVFYPLVYLLGVVLGLACVILFLFASDIAK